MAYIAKTARVSGDARGNEHNPSIVEVSDYADLVAAVRELLIAWEKNKNLSREIQALRVAHDTLSQII